MPTVQESELLTTKEAARVLHCSAGTLAFWRWEGELDLPYVRIGRAIRYHRQDLEEFIRRRRVRPRKK
jgi:excisionase family DNA binding protein